jgi:NAD(P)-dependent dehydrogenase (short-subunit alcohol dehydrogenase family)
LISAHAQALVEQAVAHFGRLDVACNNAGIGGPSAPIAAYPLDAWAQVININLSGVFYGMRQQIAAMLKTGGGAIVNMASTNGLVGEVDMVAYNASKFGVVGITMTTAIELAPHRIRVNAVAPGMIRTRLSQNFLDQNPQMAQAYLNDKIPMARFGEPSEVAATIAFLASDDSSYVTGHTLVIDGGQLTF